MSEKIWTEQQLRDEAVAYAIDAAEYQREAERLRGLLDETRAQLVEATSELAETKRELAQTLDSERAVRRRAVLAWISGVKVLMTEDVLADLGGGLSP